MNYNFYSRQRVFIYFFLQLQISFYFFWYIEKERKYIYSLRAIKKLPQLVQVKLKRLRIVFQGNDCYNILIYVFSAMRNNVIQIGWTTYTEETYF